MGEIKIDANQNGAFVMTATDLDISLIIEQEVDILESGSICLSSKNLVKSPEICRMSPCI